MSNVFHQNFTLDDNHALHARVYADNAARDADTAFNTDAAQIGKAVLVLAPAALFTLLSIAPLFLELSNTTAGDVTTSDTLVAGQLLLGNGAKDLVTEPDLNYTGTRLNFAAATGISFNGATVLNELAGDVQLSNIAFVDLTTMETIQDSVVMLDNLATVGFISGEVVGPSGAWQGDGFNAGPGDMFSINNIILLDGTGGTHTIMNIDALDATTEATIEAAIDALANLSSIQGLSVAYADAAQNAIWGWDDTGSTYRNLSQAEVQAIVGGVTTSDVLLPGQLLLGDGALNIVTEPKLFYDGTSFIIGITAGQTADSRANDLVVKNDAGDSGITIFSNAANKGHLLFGNAADPSKGEIIFDHSGNGEFTFIAGAQTILSLEASGGGMAGVGLINPNTKLHVLTVSPDTSALFTLETTGSNGAFSRDFVGIRPPEGNINGNPGDHHRHVEGALSGLSIFKGAAPGTAGWKSVSVLAPNILPFLNSADIDALASGGVITVSTTQTWRIRDLLTTANRIVVNAGVTLSIVGENNSTASITYSGTDTFLTISGFLNVRASMNLIASSTGTLISVLPGGTATFEESSFSGWALGSKVGAGGIFISDSFFNNISAGFTFTDADIVNVINIVQAGTALSGSLIALSSNNPLSSYTFDKINATALATSGSVFDFDTRINNEVIIQISETSLRTGDVFKQSTLTDATINSVADGSPATGTITAMGPNGAGGTTISCTTTYFEDEEVTISGTAAYEGPEQIFNVVAGVSFDIIKPFATDEGTGSVDSVRIVMSLAPGHGISAGDSIKALETNPYNLFYTVLDVSGDDITVNNTDAGTDSGSIERELSLDHSDPRINIQASPASPSSDLTGRAEMNGNTNATTIADGTYGPVDVTGLSLDGNVSQRIVLIDPAAGIFKALADIVVRVSATPSFLKSGSDQSYRFIFTKNGVIPSFATPGHKPIEATTTKKDTIVNDIIDVAKDETFQMLVAGNGTTNSLTTTDISYNID